MLDGHFDYGNGYHGRVYLNPHQLFRHPSTIWRFAQDLLDVLPSDLVQRTEVVAGPVTGGALLAHTIAGLLDSRRSLTHPPCMLRAVQLRSRRRLRAARRSTARDRRASACCSPTTCGTPGETFARAPRSSRTPAARSSRRWRSTIACEAIVDLGVPNFALAEYKAPENYKAGDCPLCSAGMPITRF